eukprot:scaffold78357_cov111-Phaeocystis_antarctica.AAC.2
MPREGKQRPHLAAGWVQLPKLLDWRQRCTRHAHDASPSPAVDRPALQSLKAYSSYARPVHTPRTQNATGPNASPWRRRPSTESAPSSAGAFSIIWCAKAVLAGLDDAYAELRAVANVLARRLTLPSKYSAIEEAMLLRERAEGLRRREQVWEGVTKAGAL